MRSLSRVGPVPQGGTVYAGCTTFHGKRRPRQQRYAAQARNRLAAARAISPDQSRSRAARRAPDAQPGLREALIPNPTNSLTRRSARLKSPHATKARASRSGRPSAVCPSACRVVGAESGGRDREFSGGGTVGRSGTMMARAARRTTTEARMPTIGGTGTSCRLRADQKPSNDPA